VSALCSCCEPSDRQAEGWHPAARDSRFGVTPGADAEAFYRVRREIALDSSAPTGDRLRAIEQIESRALGKPKETIATEPEEPEILQELRALTPEERRNLLRSWNEAADEQAAEGGG
jgi:hypothetical protein